MLRAVDQYWGKTRIAGNEGPNPVRSTYDVVTYLMHRNHSTKSFLENARTTQRATEKLRTLRREAKTSDLAQLLSPVTEIAFAEAIERVDTMLHNARNLQMAVRENDYPIASTFLERALDEATEFLRAVVEIIPSVSTGIRTHLAKLADELQSDRIMLESVVRLGQTPLGRLISVSREPFPGEKVVIRGKIAGGVYTIQFRDPSVSSLAEQVVAQMKAPDSLQAANKILAEARMRLPANPEIHLLAAWFHSIWRSFQLAIDELGEGIETSPTGQERELYYMRAVLFRAAGSMQEAFADCESALKLDPADPRYLKELSLLIWTNLHVPEGARAEADYDLGRAIAVTQQAYDEIREDIYLRHVVMNNLTWYLLERFEATGDAGDLAKAESWMAKLVEYGERDWAPEVHATRAHYSLVRALVGDARDSEGRRGFLEQALGDIQRVEAIPDLPKFELPLLKDMRDRVQKALGP